MAPEAAQGMSHGPPPLDRVPRVPVALVGKCSIPAV